VALRKEMEAMVPIVWEEVEVVGVVETGEGLKKEARELQTLGRTLKRCLS